jgi:riboflavin kinase / FMN adenylyltransferase
MNVYDDVTICEPSLSNLVLTIGSFDGFHRGHQYVVDEVIRIAREQGGTAGLMSLWPHPKTYFNPGPEPDLLSTPSEKKRLLESAGLDSYFVLPFNDKVASMDREDFLQEIVLKRCGATCLVIGHDFSFGKGARGDITYLKDRAGTLGFEVVELSALEWGSERVSSTQIRNLVKSGAMEDTHALLGRPYVLSGPVIRGRGLGRGLGFPTANIAPPEKLLPAFGIYAARVSWPGYSALGAVNIGLAPTVEHAGPMIEVHLLDTEMDLVGIELEVSLYHRLRGEEKFPDLATLKEAIARDILSIREYFKAKND